MSAAVLALAAALAADPALDAARRQALLYPEDYASQVALAQVAEARGQDRLAFEAWSRAVRLSRGNLESALGRLPVAVRLGETGAARADGRTAVRLAPDLPRAWTLRAWAWRSERALPGLGARIAQRAYAHALALEPGDAEAWCGLGWVRGATGDRIGARAAFTWADAAGAPCGFEGLAAHAPTTFAWGTLLATGLLYQSHPERTVGGLGAVMVGARVDDLVQLELIGRGVGLPVRDADLAPDGALVQGEAWGRAGVEHDGHGAYVLAGGTWTTGAVVTESVTVAARAFATWWATLRGGVAWTGYDDGRVLQGEVGLALPLTPALSADTGATLTRFLPSVGDADEDDRLRAAAHLGLDLQVGRTTLSAGGRVGPEVRPLRFLTASLYNLDDRLTASGWLTGRWSVGRRVALLLGYQVLRLQSPVTLDDRHQHQLTLGLTLHTRTPPRRTP